MRAAQLAVACLAAFVACETHLNVTAIGASDGLSRFECWQMNAPFSISNDKATKGAGIAQLGNVSNLIWSIGYPGQTVAAHTAPFNQWVVLLEGFAHIALAHNKSDVVYMTGGKFGILFASDTADVSKEGHISTYLGTSESVFLQIPIADGFPPEHKTLHMGPCKTEELTGS